MFAKAMSGATTVFTSINNDAITPVEVHVLNFYQTF